jgi:hypothetical protein
MYMLRFELPKDKPEPYCMVELSDNRIVYETEGTAFWRALRAFCVDNQLAIKTVTIVSNGAETPIKRNNPRFYFIVREGSVPLRGGKSSIKKGYGVICVHPGNVKGTYIEWYSNKGKYMHREVLRGTQKFYEEEIGIPSD